MKRFIVATILTAVIAGVLAHFMPRSFETYLTEFGDTATVTIYCRSTSLDGVDMGNGCGYKVVCYATRFADTASHCQDIDGVSISFEGDLDDVQRLCKFFALQVSSEYKQKGMYIVCGRSWKICGGVTDGNKLVNLQIAYKDGTVHIGSPLILGDY